MKKFIFFALCLCISTNAFADHFKVDGYDIYINASRSGKTVEVSGRLRGGDKCNTLRLDIFMHDEHGNRASTLVTLKDAGGSGSKIIEGSDQLIYPEGRNWEVSSIYTDCLSGSKSYGSTNVGNSRSSDDVGSVFIRYFDVYEIKITGNYIKLSFKVEVQNYGPAGSISMDIKGVDNNGFEIVSTLFYEKFSEDEYKALTKTKLIRLDDYERVSEWIIDSVDKY